MRSNSALQLADMYKRPLGELLLYKSRIGLVGLRPRLARNGKPPEIVMAFFRAPLKIFPMIRK